MASGVTYEGAASSSAAGQSIFAGKRLWFSRNVPSRKHIIALAQANGAVIADDEKDADVLLADHLRRPAAPGTTSYRYVELSVQRGKLEDLADHALGVADRANRVVGSVMTASKGGRTPFTEADDQFLWDWVKPYADEGGAIGGNVIYQQLEMTNPRHTYQSWRDRWLKYVSRQDRQIVNATPRPAREEPPATTTRARQTAPAQQRRNGDRAPSIVVSVDIPISSQTRPQTRLPAPNQSKTSDRAADADTITVQSPGRSQRLPRTSIQHRRPRASRSPVASNDEPTLDLADSPTASRGSSTPFSSRFRNFTLAEGRMLFKAASHILKAPEDEMAGSWAAVEGAYPEHSADGWRVFFETVVKPAYEKQMKLKEKEKQKESDRQPSIPPPQQPTCNSALRQLDDESPTTRAHPTPDSARRRSATKSTKSGGHPQESASSFSKSTGTTDGASETRQMHVVRDVEPRASPSKRKRTVSDEYLHPASSTIPSIEDIMATQQAKRTKRTHFESSVEEEVPSTPPEATAVKIVRTELEITEIIEVEEADTYLRTLRPVRDTASPSEADEDEDLFVGETNSDEPKQFHDHSPDLGNTPAQTSQMQALPISQDDEPSANAFNAAKRDIMSQAVRDAEAMQILDEGGEDPVPTSPLAVKLVSSPPEGPPLTSSFSERGDELSQELHESLEDFQTAPNSGVEEAFETAPEDLRDREKDTVPDSGNSVSIVSNEEEDEEDEASEDGEWWQYIRKIKTQELFNSKLNDDNTNLEDDLALPPPEGGWTDGQDTGAEDIHEATNDGEDTIHVADPKDKVGVDPQPATLKKSTEPLAKSSPPVITITSSSPTPSASTSQPKTQPTPSTTNPSLTTLPPVPTDANIESYLAAQEANPTVDQLALIDAIDATCFDRALVVPVYTVLTTGKGMPRDLRGVWTPEDDEALGSGDARGIRRLEGKHGVDGVERRWKFREGG